ncbi:MAG: hypothetical protein ACQCN4_06255 [Candidatus Bathyarchaeia archaeon]
MSIAKKLIHMDIYAMVEATQELHFGNVKDLNVNRVELISVPKDNIIIQKPYMSPTKVRGVARRALLWELLRLGDEKILSCGIPATCGECDLCRLYGALVTTQKSKKQNNKKTLTQQNLTQEEIKVEDNAKAIKNTPPQETDAGEAEGSIASRVIQAGGVAVQELSPAVKQRLSSPCYITSGKIGQYNPEEIKNLLRTRGIAEKAIDRLSQPLPYEKEYVTGLFPIYWHSYYLESSKRAESKMSEPQMVAFSFIETLKRIGAGHPKGSEIKESEIFGKPQPLIVVDVYNKPLGKRPIVSVSETSEKIAIETFIRKAQTVDGTEIQKGHVSFPKDGASIFERFIGDEAETFLRRLASGLATDSAFLATQENSTPTGAVQKK